MPISEQCFIWQLPSMLKKTPSKGALDWQDGHLSPLKGDNVFSNCCLRLEGQHAQAEFSCCQTALVPRALGWQVSSDVLSLWLGG